MLVLCFVFLGVLLVPETSLTSNTLRNGSGMLQKGEGENATSKNCWGHNAHRECLRRQQLLVFFFFFFFFLGFWLSRHQFLQRVQFFRTNRAMLRIKQNLPARSRKRGEAPISRMGKGVPGFRIERASSHEGVSAPDHQATPAASSYWCRRNHYRLSLKSLSLWPYISSSWRLHELCSEYLLNALDTELRQDC